MIEVLITVLVSLLGLLGTIVGVLLARRSNKTAKKLEADIAAKVKLEHESMVGLLQPPTPGCKHLISQCEPVMVDSPNFDKELVRVICTNCGVDFQPRVQDRQEWGDLKGKAVQQRVKPIKREAPKPIKPLPDDHYLPAGYKRSIQDDFFMLGEHDFYESSTIPNYYDGRAHASYY